MRNVTVCCSQQKGIGMRCCKVAGVVLLLWVCGVACKSEPASKPASVSTPSQTDRALNKTAKPAAAVNNFEPLVVCAGALEPSLIPAHPLRGEFARHLQAELDLPFAFVDGHAIVRDDRIAVRLAGEPLRHCSAEAASGGAQKNSRLSLALDALHKGLYRFPDPARHLKYWNHVYTGEDGRPFTLGAFSAQDAALIQIDAVMHEERKVRGRAIFCRAGGTKGWAAGTFEIALCDGKVP